MSMLLEPPIVLNGELSLADVLVANKLMQPSRRRMFLLTIYVFAAVVLFSIGYAVQPFDEGWPVWLFATGIVVYGLILIYPAYRDRSLIQRAWKTKTGVFHPVDTTITKDGLTILEPHREITVGWDHFVAALTSPTVIFLFPSEGWILFGRSRFANEYDWNRFKAYVDDRFPIKPRLV
jgi:hypothetical protein